MFNQAFLFKKKKKTIQILSAGREVGVCVWQNQSLYVMRLQKANRKQGVKAAGRQMHLTEGKEILAIKPPAQTEQVAS